MSIYYLRHDSGADLYAKPLPLVADPWAADSLSLIETGSTGSYSIDLDDDTPHEVFVRAGATADATDEAIAMIVPDAAAAVELAPEDIQSIADTVAAAVGDGGIDTDQIVADILAGLESVSVQITRIGPEFDPATSTVTLIAGDDYLVANDAALTFGLTLPGIDLTGATAVFSAEKSYAPVLLGTAELIDTDTDQPKLRLSWTREQTSVMPAKYCWGVAIIDAGGLVKTIIGGPLILKPSAVNTAVVGAALEQL